MKKAKHQDSSDARGASGAELETARQTRKDKGKKKSENQDAVGSDVDLELLDDYLGGASNLAEEHEEDSEPENFNLDDVRSESESDHEANASELSTSSSVSLPSVPPISTLGGTDTDKAQLKAAGKAQPKKSGAAQPKPSGAAGANKSGAAGSKPSAAAGAKKSGAAGSKASAAAGAKKSGVAGSKASAAAGSKSSGAAGSKPSGAAGTYSAVEVEPDSDFFIPGEDYDPVEPEKFSPAEALAEKKQAPFLVWLNYRAEYMAIVPHVDMSYVAEGAFLENMPPYLCWWHPGSTLPPVFHNMTLEKFNELLLFLLAPGTVSGRVSHPTLLALGLIIRELEASNMFSPDETLHPPVLTTDHFDAYISGVKALSKVVVATAERNALTYPVPAVRTTDKLGYIIADPLPVADTEHGSPLDAAGGSRASAAKYIGSLSKHEVFQLAVGIMNKGKIEKSPWSAGIMVSLSWLRPTYYSGAPIHGTKDLQFREIIAEMVNTAKSRDDHVILHTYVLAFGLVFRDISAAISTNRGTPTDPPLPIISSLTSKDEDFAITQLVDLLKWAKHLVYEVEGQKRVGKATGRAGRQ